MIIKAEQIEPLANNFKVRNKKIVLAGGCFDVLHEAHIEFLKKSKEKGDILFILLESDNNIKNLKGKDRPKNDIDKRSKELESLGFIDIIAILPDKVSDLYYYNLTKLIQPDIIALTKNDPLAKKKMEQAEMAGGKVEEVMDRDEKHSSTELINK